MRLRRAAVFVFRFVAHFVVSSVLPGEPGLPDISEINGIHCPLPFKPWNPSPDPESPSRVLVPPAVKLPAGEIASGRRQAYCLVSLASRWKGLSSSERDRACGKAFDHVKRGEIDE